MYYKQIPVQFWSILWVTLIVIIFSLWANKQIKKDSKNKVPSKFVVFIEMYVEGFNNLMESITGGKLRKAYPYFFTLFNFILFNSFLSLFGFEPAPSSFMFTLTLGLITFLGMYIIGICTYGLFRFMKEKYANPVEIFTQFSPLLSISIRLFAATLATAVIGQVFAIVLTSLGYSILASGMPIIVVFLSWGWILIDTFLGIIQAFVFTVLTAIYWTGSHGPSWNRSERKKHYQAEKELKKQLRAEKKKAKDGN